MDKGTKIFYKKGKQEIKTAYVVAWNDHPYNQTYFVASDNPDDKTSKKFLIPKSQVIKNPKSNPEMTNETLRMQLLSGVITESEYKAKLEESKKPLNENFVGMGMVGNIFDREKTDYELAFEHFTKGTSLNEYMEDEMPEAPSHEETDAAQVYEEEVEEAMVNPNTSDRVSYLENTLDMVWKRGRGNNPIDFKDLAQSIVNDMFDDLEETLNENFIQGDETVKNQLKTYFEEMAKNYPENLASVLTGLVMGEDPTFEDFVSRVSNDISGDDNPFGLD